MADMVNHPPHCTSDPSGVECIQITRHRNFNIGNAIKYLWRAGLKLEEAATPIEGVPYLAARKVSHANEIGRLQAEHDKEQSA